MYRKILAAVNEFTNSEHAARYAVALARSCGASLSFVFVAEDKIDKLTFRRAESALERLFIEAEENGVDVQSMIETGDPLEKITEIVKREDIDIVFAATRREDIERRFYAGTIARSLSLKLPCSVALVRVVHMGRAHPKNILVPLKARIDCIKERVYFTAKMAEGFHSRVFVFHVTAPITKFFHGEMHLTPAQWEKKVPEDIADFIRQINKYRIESEGRLAPGHTSRSITVESAAKRHDLIIMGASKRSLLKSIIRGNPVEDVLRKTVCDLIIFNPRHEDK